MKCWNFKPKLLWNHVVELRRQPIPALINRQRPSTILISDLSTSTINPYGSSFSPNPERYPRAFNAPQPPVTTPQRRSANNAAMLINPESTFKNPNNLSTLTKPQQPSLNLENPLTKPKTSRRAQQP